MWGASHKKPAQHISKREIFFPLYYWSTLKSHKVPGLINSCWSLKIRESLKFLKTFDKKANILKKEFDAIFYWFVTDVFFVNTIKRNKNFHKTFSYWNNYTIQFFAAITLTNSVLIYIFHFTFVLKLFYGWIQIAILNLEFYDFYGWWKSFFYFCRK